VSGGSWEEEQEEDLADMFHCVQLNLFFLYWSLNSGPIP
jgi:hypothetical protein